MRSETINTPRFATVIDATAIDPQNLPSAHILDRHSEVPLAVHEAGLATDLREIRAFSAGQVYNRSAQDFFQYSAPHLHRKCTYSNVEHFSDVMNAHQHGAEELIRLARAGDREVLADLLERYRPRLEGLARRQMDDRLAKRIGGSDIVQQTFLSAINHFENFEGSEESELFAWLQQIHKRNILEAARHHLHAQKRDVSREQQRGENQSTGAYFPSAGATSPSQKAIRAEESNRLLCALEELTEDQREAVRLKYLDGCKLAEIADRMGRSEEAAAGLLKRGLQNLRKQVSHDDDE